VVEEDGRGVGVAMEGAGVKTRMAESSMKEGEERLAEEV
jgi:hypothetical protein